MHELLVQHAGPGPATSSRMHARRRALRVRASASALHEHVHARGHRACMRTSVACAHAECARRHAPDAHGIRVRPACALAGARALVPCCMRSDARTTARPTMHARAMRTRPPARPPARPHLVSLSRIDRAVLQLRKVPGSGLARSLFASSPPSLPLLPSSLLLFSGPGGGPRAGAPKTSRERPGALPGSLPFSGLRLRSFFFSDG